MLIENELYQQYPTIAYRKYHKLDYDYSLRFAYFRAWFEENQDQLTRLFMRAHDYDRYLLEVWAQERYYYFLYNQYMHDVNLEINLLTM